MSRLRTTIRLRLTVTYTVFFLLAMTLLAGLNYLLFTRTIYQPLGTAQLQGMVVTVFDGSGVSQQEVRALEADPARRAEFLRALDVELAVQRQLRDDALRTMLLQSVLVLAAMAVVAVGLGWLAAGRALRPVRDITRVARRASEHSLHERIGLQGPSDELKELADTIDGMLSRLERAFEAQQRFVASASHELRTPLSIMRTAVDVALSDGHASRADLTESAREVRAAVDRAEALIESLLILARSDQRVQADDYVDLADLVQDSLEAAAAAAELDVTVTTELGPAPVRGDRALLETMVDNLVANGVRHNVPGGAVGVATAARDGRSALVIANSGPAVAADDVPALFEPFRRGSAPRVGSDRGVGLGLSIVRAVATSHGGGVQARARAEGGLEVTAWLPSA